MNTKTRTHIVSLYLLLVAPFGALEGLATESPAEEPRIVIDCAKPTLPSQREVGELVGQYNLGQVYATRSRLMAEVNRACQRKGTARVLVQLPPAPRLDERKLASRTPAR